MKVSPLRSAAQHRMMVRAVADPAYAKQRGITKEAAQQLLDAHEEAGSPRLPERVEKKA